jgi:hypothetical protein
MDADLQDDPGEGPLLLERLEAGCEMVVAWRHPRADALHKRIASALYNGVVSYSSGLHLHDHNCGLKALTKEAALTLPLYGDLHRYMSVLAANEGFRVSEVEVRHRPRAFGRSKYTTLRLVTSLLDFIAVFFLLRYAKRPLRLLGFCGLALTGLGAAALFYLAVSWCQGHSIGHRPLLVYATVVSIFGLNVSVLGIIGELLVWSLDRSVRLAPDPLVSEDTPAVVPRAAVCSPTLA